jgi:outer membrane protein OmpA-like peptidoglycan-associated protein
MSVNVHGLSSLALLLLAAQAVQAQMYGGDLSSSEWKAASNPFVCGLTHTIPNFGKAVLSRKAGEAEVFYLESQGKAVFPGSIAGAETLPPPWRNDVVVVPLGAFKVDAGAKPITLTATQVAPISAQLSAGMNVMFSSQPVVTSSSAPSITRVVLNAKNFSAGYKTYQQCITDLIPYTYAQVSRTSLNFGEKAEGLSAAQKSELSKVARYIKADSKVVGVFVDGHSDNSGTAEANEDSSKQRAEWVTTYLVAQGVVDSKITTRWHGDKFFIADNKTATGRTQNRRVTVRLEDEAAHREFMKKEEEKRKANEKEASEKASAEKLAAESKTASSNAASSQSSKAKMSPEDISRMIEGYDLKNP